MKEELPVKFELGAKCGKSDQERLVIWNSIDNVPAFEWVCLYSPEYHKTAGREKKGGVMQ